MGWLTASDMSRSGMDEMGCSLSEGEGEEQDKRGREMERVRWRGDEETWIKTKALERERSRKRQRRGSRLFVEGEMSEIKRRKRKAQSIFFLGNHSRANNPSVYRVAWLKSHKQSLSVVSYLAKVSLCQLR